MIVYCSELEHQYIYLRPRLKEAANADHIVGADGNGAHTVWNFGGKTDAGSRSCQQFVRYRFIFGHRV